MLVPFVNTPTPKMVEPWVNHSVSSVGFPFSGRTQTQSSTGADLEGWMLTYAALKPAQAAPLVAMLKPLRGISRAMQWTPADCRGPQGTPSGSPLVNGAHVAAATMLSMKAWPVSTAHLLKPNDLIQIGPAACGAGCRDL